MSMRRSYLGGNLKDRSVIFESLRAAMVNCCQVNTTGQRVLKITGKERASESGARNC
jgi:hypothetical protein